MTGWIQEGIALAKQKALTEVVITNAKEEEEVAAVGYEVERQQSGEINGDTIEWTERVLVVKSYNHATQQERGLEKRVCHAEEKLRALTPSRGRGKRQISDEQTLKESIEAILKTHRGEGLLTVEYEKHVERRTKYVGRGRGGANRQQEVAERIRDHLTAVTRDAQKIEGVKETFGWRAYVTDTPRERVCLEDAITLYRQECRIERIFHRLKSR